MAFEGSEILTILAKADRTIHKLGTLADTRRFSENDLSLYNDRAVIFLFKKAVEFGYASHLGEIDYDILAGTLLSKCTLYGFGSLAPLYGGSALSYNTLGSNSGLNIANKPDMIENGNWANNDKALKFLASDGNYYYVQIVDKIA